MNRVSAVLVAIVLAAATHTDVRADTRLAYVLGSFAAEELATPKRCVSSFKKGNAELAYEIESVFPDRLHMIVTSQAGRQELYVIGKRMFLERNGAWTTTPSMLEPRPLPSVLQIIRSRLTDLTEDPPINEKGMALRRFRGAVNWSFASETNTGTVDIAIDTTLNLPRRVAFKGVCGQLPCAFAQTLSYDPSIVIKSPMP